VPHPSEEAAARSPRQYDNRTHMPPSVFGHAGLGSKLTLVMRQECSVV
jgi:hypothetical protein